MSLAIATATARPLGIRLATQEFPELLNRLPATAWQHHKHTESGMASAILVSVGGTANHDYPLSGPMMETPLMANTPLLRRIAYALDIQLSRCRLLRISPGAQTPPLTDDSYYWYRHAPVYIPLQLSKGVEFYCADQPQPMREGEIWPLAADLPQWINNLSSQDAIWLILESRAAPRLEGFTQRLRQAANLMLFSQPGYRFEMLEPAELAVLCNDIQYALESATFAETEKTAYLQALHSFQQQWAHTFAHFGHDRHGELSYFDCVQDFLEQVFNPAARLIKNYPRAQKAAHIIRSMLWTAPPPPKRLNQQRLAHFQSRRLPPLRWQGLYQSIEHLNSAHLPPQQQQLLRLFAQPRTAAAVQSQAPLPPATFAGATQQLLARKRLQEVIQCPTFERPVFILSAPRAGSTLLFETLCHVPGLWSVGGESHELFETIPALHPQAHDYDSNRLTAADAQPDTVAWLQENFSHRLQDRDARAYLSLPLQERPSAVRFLEKTPKNALRVALLKAAFPDARFIFLYRNPRENISSMLEGWRSRRFLAYRHLPDWPHKEWHFLLPPGWRELRNASLAEIAAWQWLAANQYTLDDLQALPRSHWFALSYQTLIQHPQQSVQALRDFARWDWDERIAARVAQALPVSHMTLSAPCSEKWQRHEHEMRTILPGLAAFEAQVAQVLAQQATLYPPVTGGKKATSSPSCT